MIRRQRRKRRLLTQSNFLYRKKPVVRHRLFLLSNKSFDAYPFIEGGAEMKDLFSECRIEIGPMTLTMKAQKALSGAAIPSAVIKNDSSFSSRGCSYGLRISCAQRVNAQSVLSHEGIRVKKWINAPQDT